MKNKKIIITGIQNTNTPHIGNIFGMINPTINSNNTKNNISMIFIADLHTLTQIKNKPLLKINTYKILSIFLALGLKINYNTIIYRQSKITEITELAWYLSCFYPYNRLKLAHSFKDKKQHMSNINVGLFNYPILMAADILLFNADTVIVGKDQLQHIEITRNIAKKINSFKKNVFKLPQALTNTSTMIVPGIDGRKMSKSKNNVIDIFASKKQLKTQIMKIKTNNISIEACKPIKNDIIFNLYKLIADKNEINIMKCNYMKKGYSYHKAKLLLYNKILKKFSLARNQFKYFMKNKQIINNILMNGEKKIKTIARKNISIIRKLFFT